MSKDIDILRHQLQTVNVRLVGVIEQFHILEKERIALSTRKQALIREIEELKNK